MAVDSITNLKPENLPKDRSLQLKEIVAKVVGGESDQVKFANFDEYEKGEIRFLNGFVKLPSGRECFIKIGGRGKENPSEPGTEQLERESISMQLAKEIGWQIAELIVSAIDIENNPREVLIGVELLSSENGQILASNELIAAAKADLGKEPAKLLATCSREIPKEIEIANLKRGDWRSSSPDHLKMLWQEEKEEVLEKYSEEEFGFISKDELTKIINKGEGVLEELLKKTIFSESEYLVHNDMAPNNTYFDQNGNVIILDWEHAGATHYKLLAKLTDMTNYWGRCWPNPEMQSEFIKSYFETETKAGENPQLTSLLLKTMVVHGSLFLAKYGMETNHPEHNMSKSLLSNLKRNLETVESCQAGY